MYAVSYVQMCVNLYNMHNLKSLCFLSDEYSMPDQFTSLVKRPVEACISECLLVHKILFSKNLLVVSSIFNCDR